MDRIAKIAHIRKGARIESRAHAVKITGSADYWRPVNTSGLRGNGMDGTIKGLTANALARLRDAISNTTHTSGDYRVYGLCLTIPWGDKDGGPGSPTQADGREIWEDWTHHLNRWLDAWSVGMIYRVELQQRRAVHWHLLAYVPARIDCAALNAAWEKALRKCFDPFAVMTCKQTKHERPMIDIGDGPAEHSTLLHLLRLTWIEALHKWHTGATAARAFARFSHEGPPPPSPVMSWGYCFNAIALDGVKSGLAYLAAHTTKHKQAQLGYTGKQWGYLGRKHLREVPPLDLSGGADLTHALRIPAYRLLRLWVKRNRPGSDWRVVRPSRRLQGDSEIYGGLTVRNVRSIYLFGVPPGVVSRAIDCARLTLPPPAPDYEPFDVIST